MQMGRPVRVSAVGSRPSVRLCLANRSHRHESILLCAADPKAQAAGRAEHAERVAALSEECAQLRQAAEAAQADAAAARQERASALELLPPRRRSTYEAATRSGAALARITASRRGNQQVQRSPSLGCGKRD